VDHSCCNPNSRGFAATLQFLFTKSRDMRTVACRLAVVVGQIINSNSSCCCGEADIRVKSSFSSLMRTELEMQSKTAIRSSGYSKTFPVSVRVFQGGLLEFVDSFDGESQARSKGSSSLTSQVSILRYMVIARSRTRSCRLSGSVWSREQLPSGFDIFDTSENRFGMSTSKSQSSARKERLGGPWATGDAAGS